MAQIDENPGISVTDHCKIKKEHLPNDSITTIQPILSLRKNLQIDQDVKILRKLPGFELDKKQEPPKKLQQININMEIPAIRTTGSPKTRLIPKFKQQKRRQLENRDSLEIIYSSKESLDDHEKFQPIFESSPLTKYQVKSTIVQTELDQDTDDDDDVDENEDLDKRKDSRRVRKIKKNLFQRHTFTKCKQSLLKSFYYGIKLSNYQNVINKNHNLFNAIVAYCLTKIKKIKKWTRDDLDLILQNGKKFYENTPIDCQLTNYCLINFDNCKIIKKCYYQFDKKPKIIGNLLTKNRRIYNLTKGLKIYFQYYNCCILQIDNFYNFLIWKTKFFYYYFDTTTLKNYAILANFDRLKAVITVLLKNQQFSNKKCETKFKIYPIKIVNIANTNNGNYKNQFDKNNDENSFRIINEKKAIILGNFDINNKQFGIVRNKQSLITTIIALIYSKIIITNCWIQQTINQIVILGNHLFLQLINNNNNNLITIDNLPNKLPIGAFIVEFTINKDCIVIINDRQQLKSGLNDFFANNNNNNGIIEIINNNNNNENCVLAIWKQRDFYYLFDPYLCDIDGYRLYANNGGGACLTTTTTLDTIVDTIEHNFNNNYNNFKIHSFDMVRLMNQLKINQTFDQQLMEIDAKIVNIVDSCCTTMSDIVVDLDNDSLFEFPTTQQQLQEKDDDYDDLNEFEDHESSIQSIIIVDKKLSKCTNTEFVINKMKLPSKQLLFNYNNSENKLCSTKTINDYHQTDLDEIEFLLPFVYIIASVFIKHYKIEKFTINLIDNIIKYGIELFKLFNKRYDEFINFIIKTIKINNNNYQVKINYLIEIKMELKQLKSVLEDYLNKFNCLILITPNYCCLIYLNKHRYYLFDCINNNNNSGCFLCFNNLQAIVVKILNNKARCDMFNQTICYDNCVISSCIVDEIVDKTLLIIDDDDDDDKKDEKYVKIDNKLCLNYYNCLCANLLLLTLNLTKKLWNNPKFINEILYKGKLLYFNDNERNIYTKKIIKNLLINNYYFNVIIEMILLKKTKNFNEDLQFIIKKHQYFLLQFCNCFYSIFVDRKTNFYYLFDTIHVNKTKWLEFKDFEQIVNHIVNDNDDDDDDDGRIKNYRFYQFEIVSFVKKSKKSK